MFLYVPYNLDTFFSPHETRVFVVPRILLAFLRLLHVPLVDHPLVQAEVPGGVAGGDGLAGGQQAAGVEDQGDQGGGRLLEKKKKRI